jgi:hypothetical protein
MLPPGRAMFETSPKATGSPEMATIGIVVVAALTARAGIMSVEKIASGRVSTISRAS